jgi:glycosyltransferase involved in cell wall biosynthesis
MVSFIIPAHNEEQLLGRTLAAIHEAARAVDEPFEVIVADDESTDRTSEIALTHGARVVRAQCRQIAGARNAGAREAKGEFLVFVDADTTVNEAAVKAAVNAMRGGAVGGGCPFRFDGRLPWYGRWIALAGEPLYRALGLASGCFLFCTRKAFVAAGGFDEQFFAAEEAVMSRALGRHGRFVILREQVITSGRKLRTHSAGEMLRTVWKFAKAGGLNAARAREGLDVWYGERRNDSMDG